jgi:hypothetical protein
VPQPTVYRYFPDRKALHNADPDGVVVAHGGHQGGYAVYCCGDVPVGSGHVDRTVPISLPRP